MTGYLAAENFCDQLLAELQAVEAVHGRLILTRAPPQPAVWAANVWFDPIRISFGSIAEAARKLRGIQRDWALYSFRLHRRAQLIAELLPPLKIQPTTFPAPLPPRPIGSWTLLDEHTLLAAARCSSPWPHGEIQFVEDHHAPPSRAYLKLWELFSRIRVWPKPCEHCVDLGASPGGWTWALQRLGAHVLAVDKAPLAPRVAALPNIEFRKTSAFAVKPEPVDWLFCDVVCYPQRLLRLVRRWLPVARNLVCTIKFQGKTDPAIARAFAAIPGSDLMHLHHNRHELTWVRLSG